MQLKDYIEEGAKKAGSLSELGRMLCLQQQTISAAKGHKRPLPVKAVVQLADYIGADLRSVIAANELVTEKDEDKRRFWSPFVDHAKAASIALGLALVTNFVTPTPAEAHQSKTAESNSLYYVKRRMKATLKKRHLFWSFLPLFKSMFKSDTPRLTRRVFQP